VQYLADLSQRFGLGASNLLRDLSFCVEFDQSLHVRGVERGGDEWHRANTRLFSSEDDAKRSLAADEEVDNTHAAGVRQGIDQFLASRGSSQKTASPPAAPATARPDPIAAVPPAGASSASAPATPVPFVCEDDVRQALKTNAKIVVGERTIITPAARDLGEAHGVFVQATFRA